MIELRDKIAYELGIAMNELNNTFECRLNWYLYKKVKELGLMLDKCEDLITKEKELG